MNLEYDDDCDLFDAGDNPHYSRNAERRLLGCLIADPAAAVDVVGLVGSVDFYEPLHAALFGAFERHICEGATLDNADLIASIGGDPEAEVFGRSAKQYLGYLTGLGFEDGAPPAEVAQAIQQLAERRATSLEPIKWEPPFHSTMGLKMWADQNDPGIEQYEYLVEDLIPDRQGVIIHGETQTGKSFLCYHLGMCLARAVPFFGRRILKPVGVVWLAFEASVGATARMRAYARYHDLPVEPLPFAVLTKPVPMWPDERGGGGNPNDPQAPKRASATDLIIEEIARIRAEKFPPSVEQLVVIIDTQNAATPGASEIDSEVVSKIRGQFHKIITELGATLIVVGHSNTSGKLRGNEQLTNNFDTVLKVTRKTFTVGRDIFQVKDGDGREVRNVKVAKQREGIDSEAHDFVLHQVEDGTINRFGKKRTSCVITPPTPKAGEEREEKAPLPRGYVRLAPREFQAWEAFVVALKASAEMPPSGVRAPPGTLGVKLEVWREVLARSMTEIEEADRLKIAKGRINNVITKWRDRLVQGDNAFYWRGRLKVDGIDDPPPAAKPTDNLPDDFDPRDFPPN